MIRLSDIPLRGHESRVARCFLLLLVPLLCAGTAFGGDACRNEAAEKAFQEGFRLQKRMESQAALAAYRRCLSIEPTCLACRYELGWSLWQLGRWREVVEVWEGILAEVPDHPEVRAFLPQAREHLAGKGKANTVRHPPIGTPSQPATAPIHLELIARFQNYDAAPADPRDHFDPDIASPKSAIFTPDGRKVYVNSLEGMKTVVYDAKRLVKRKVIRHTFGRESARYFREDTFFGRPLGGDRGPKNPNHFSGKPVEAALSHGGRFLWVPYYRRSYDPKGIAPSAVAIIDTERDEIVRVIATGPISKCVAPSPDGRFMAISHWGDN
ncbi:MAG: tetratricopeptide repeat protein, partial [Deltaproteobacteria bacterium]